MEKIIKLLKSKGYEVNHESNSKRWIIDYVGELKTYINRHNEERTYNEGFSIWKDIYGNYLIGVTTGYNKATTELKTTKLSNVIEWIENNL